MNVLSPCTFDRGAGNTHNRRDVEPALTLQIFTFYFNPQYHNYSLTSHLCLCLSPVLSIYCVYTCV